MMMRKKRDYDGDEKGILWWERNEIMMMREKMD